MARVNDDICSCSNEDDLVRAAITGDCIARDALITKYTGLVWHVVRRRERDHHLVEDFVQDVFLSAFRCLESYQGNAKFGAWLCGIANNTVSNQVRRQKRRKSQSLSSLEGSIDPVSNDNPESQAIKAEDIAKVNRGIACLPESSRALIQASHFEDLSLAETAGVFDIPVGTVKSRLHRARRQLRSILEEVA